MKVTDCDLSIVIAAWPDTTGLSNCLESIAAQGDERTEVIVASSTAAPPEMKERFPQVDWLAGGKERLIPELWSLGLARAAGEIVATTTAHCVPASDWIARMRGAHERLDAAGIGGAIDPPHQGRAIEWATYFLRYSNYFACRGAESVSEIAADNASYKREALMAHREAISGGFWEPSFHRLLFADGRTLAFVPDIRVRLAATPGFKRFFAQRLRHGRHFGHERMRGKPLPFRVAGLLAAPLIPILLLMKITRRLFAQPAYLGAFLRSLPLLLLFLLSWAFGEAWGYLAALSSDSSSLAAERHVSA
ncbi:MAG: glycosyltransferase [Chthoniobacterales bacterium]